VNQRSVKPNLDSAFAALSDSSRREMIRMLLHRRHLRVLRKAGLVSEEGIEDDARVRIYSVHPAAFQPVQQWLAQVEELWRGQLHAFAAGTLVTVTHSGLSALRSDHPARHGLQGSDFSRMIGLWWGDQMNSLREICGARRS
jgi:hypothetical protein